jgi:hypothetical protein
MVGVETEVDPLGPPSGVLLPVPELLLNGWMTAGGTAADFELQFIAFMTCNSSIFVQLCNSFTNLSDSPHVFILGQTFLEDVFLDLSRISRHRQIRCILPVSGQFRLT